MLEWRMTGGIHLQSAPLPLGLYGSSSQALWTLSAADISQDHDHLSAVSQDAPDHTEAGDGGGMTSGTS